MRHARLVPLIALPAVAAGALLLGTGASAQDPPARIITFTESDRGATFAHIRNTNAKPRTANRAGDIIVFTNPLTDAGGDRVGKLAVSCVTTTGAKDFRKSVVTCNGIVTLRGGTLTLQTHVRPNVERTTGAITGGTGAYANARGVFVSVVRRGGDQTTVTLAP